VTLTPSRRLYSLGVIMLVALAICSRNFSSLGAPVFLVPLAFAGLAYLFAIREFFGTPEFPRHVFVIGLALAAVWHVLFLRMPPGPDDDVHRYVWDGRVQRLGYNPYLLVPSDPALAGLHTSETHTLNNSYLPSPYPAGAQLFFRAVTAIHESVFAFKVAFVLCDVAIVVGLLYILRWSGQGTHWVLAYAWNPLLATEVAGSGHIDIVGALLLLVSFAALIRRWRRVAAVAFALAVAVKFLPIVLLPLYWKRIRVRDGALAALAEHGGGAHFGEHPPAAGAFDAVRFRVGWRCWLVATSGRHREDQGSRHGQQRDSSFCPKWRELPVGAKIQNPDVIKRCSSPH